MTAPLTASIFLLTFAIAIGFFARQNPLLFGLNAGNLDRISDEEFRVIAENAVLDEILLRHKRELGQDYERYRNHCLRVLSFTAFHLSGSRQPSDRDITVAAVALAYHDIALWTDGELNYLNPSNVVMRKEMEEIANLKVDDEPIGTSDHLMPTLSSIELTTVSQAILQHHKVTDWKAPTGEESSVDVELVNAIRKGDWADATYGILKFGLPTSYLQKAYLEIPEAGFHLMLAGMGRRLSPRSLLGQLAVLKILKL